jgi:3D (Asp-Asp-Asp) domain-containing protein
MLSIILALALTIPPVHAEVTAYAPLDNVSGICANEDATTTATGTYPTWGTVAVDPRKIPYGTWLYIPGYGLGKAVDTGGYLRRNPNHHLDLYHDTYHQAMAWGRKHMDVYIIHLE